MTQLLIFLILIFSIFAAGVIFLVGEIEKINWQLAQIKKVKERKSLEIEKEAKVAEEKLKELMERKAGRVIKALIQDFSNKLSKKASEGIKISEKVIKDIEILLKRQTINLQEELKEKINQEYQKMEEEIQKAREEKLAKLDGEIFQIVQEAIRRTTGKVLTPAEHEELVFEALKEAKSERVI